MLYNFELQMMGVILLTAMVVGGVSLWYKRRKIRKELGWLHKTNFEDGIAKTISWYLSNDSWIDSFPDSVTKSTPWK